jgi:hypothetical protein
MTAVDRPIVFTHYGNSDYLSSTLECAALTNRQARRILIGDSTNRLTATRAGWEHVHMDDVHSPARDEFVKAFRWIQGANHNPMRNGKDWLKYVFERWFVVSRYCADQNIESFWHFDSDVMIVEPLDAFASDLLGRGFDYTKQCNDTCLNGLVSERVLADFCRFLVEIFNDAPFLQQLQREFAPHPEFAFTEMAAFELFAAKARFRGCHLESAFEGWWFDDCICQDDGFEMARLGWFGKPIKRIRFDGTAFLGKRLGSQRRFAAINCSWVPTAVFGRILRCVEARHHAVPTVAEVHRIRLGVRTEIGAMLNLVRSKVSG